VNNEKYLRDALAKQAGREHVTDAILNEDGQRARKEIQNALRKGSKAKAFDRKNKRRKKRR
jgi:hypothetical protein